jgi:outer membrane protein OmpA-like peptidoglycan-associated protein
MPSFCTKCGAQISEPGKFCTRCGAPTEMAAVSPPSKVGPSTAGTPPARTGVRPWMILTGIALVLFFGIMGSCFYVGLRVKKGVQEMISGNDSSGRSGGSGSRGAIIVDQTESCPVIDQTRATTYQQSDEAARIPLKAGLTLVKIWSTRGQDVESLTQVKSVDKDSLTLKNSAPHVVKGVLVDTISGERTICQADLETGITYMTQFGQGTPAVVRTATAFSLSTLAFNNLKTKGSTGLTYIQNVRMVDSGGYRIGMQQEGSLQRLESQSVPFSVLVNGDESQLPTIHARGKLGRLAAEVYILDDPANPVVLDFILDHGRFLDLKLVKISYPVERKIEKDLKEKGRTDVYGIYFDFASDHLRPESTPVLQDIAEVLRNNSDWKLSVGGHTDNIGGDAYNLDLSNRRAAAVKRALVEQYQIAADRLHPVGYGASRPKATNDTVEGRALNRRVELVRE